MQRRRFLQTSVQVVGGWSAMATLGTHAVAKSDDENYLPHDLQEPRSPYEVKAGWLIPAILETGLHSEQSGMVKARVRQQVFDTVTGRYVLIPQGTLLIGDYDPKLLY